MSDSTSSLTFKRIVNRQVVLQLVKLWLTITEEEENQLITENTLLKLAKIDKQVDYNRELATESFFLLISPEFNAFLSIEQLLIYQKYRITIVLDSVTILNKLINIGRQNKWGNNAIEYIKTKFVKKLNFSQSNYQKFILILAKLLSDDEDKTEYNHIFSTHPKMDKLLHYQVKQEHIFEQIKSQISQNLDLSDIIQTAINHTRNFLELDRLLIYQLDVPLKSDLISESVHTIDTVTYEAKKENVNSLLYFKGENCWRKFKECTNKYHQGVSLVIDNVEHNSNLNFCLKSLLQKLQVKAKIVTPIQVRGKLWGLIIAHQCFQSRTWNHQDVKFLHQITDYLVFSIQHHQSYQQLQQQKILLEEQVQTQAQQIKDALIAAEAASKSKHEFLGSMSHELRTPLTRVIGLSSTLLQWSSTKSNVPLSPEKQQQYLHLIQQSGKHLLSLINNILEFSDVESGKHLLNIKQISLKEITNQSLQMLREKAQEKNIALNAEVNLKADSEYFFADEIRLKEILFNLLDNGIKFTPENGEVILRIWRERRQVIFQVEDTGIGIAPNEIPLLFEKFKQIENFKHRTQGGTGLGLALTKKLVELHGGNIEVESALNEGSFFTVYLPVKTPFDPYLNRKSSTSEKSSSSSTIVLVTEDEQCATFMCQILNAIDCQVVWLMDSIMAMNQIELLEPKLIIVDRDFDCEGINNIASAIAQSSLSNHIDLVILEGGEEHNNIHITQSDFNLANRLTSLNSRTPKSSLKEEHLQQFYPSQVGGYLNKSMTPAEIINKISSLLKIYKENRLS